MTLAYAFAWLASIAATVYLMIRRSAPVLDAADAAIDADNQTIGDQRKAITDLRDRLWLAEQERDQAQAQLANRIARRSEASKRAAETRRARQVLIEPPALAGLASDAEGAE